MPQSAPVFAPLFFSVEGGGPVEEEIDVEGLGFLLVGLLLSGGVMVLVCDGVSHTFTYVYIYRHIFICRNITPGGR